MPIVEAVFVSAAAKDHRLAEAIENAMRLAIEQATAEGVSDPVEIKARILHARQRIKDERFA